MHYSIYHTKTKYDLKIVKYLYTIRTVKMYSKIISILNHNLACYIPSFGIYFMLTINIHPYDQSVKKHAYYVHRNRSSNYNQLITL